MNGYQITFYTTLRSQIQGKHVKDWLLRNARELGIPGATVFAGIEGYGHHGRLHSAHFFDVADEPIMIVMAITEVHKQQLLARLSEASSDVFYVIQAAEISDRAVG